MEKLTFSELTKIISEHNARYDIRSQYSDKNALNCVVVYKDKQKAWGGKSYSLASRSYTFTSDNKRFIPCMCGGSIFATNLDKSDINVRLDWLFGEWEIDYCYIVGACE